MRRASTRKPRPDGDRDLVEPDDVASLRLARIVHRLVTDPSGWTVRELCEDLGIAERTFRKYRRLLETSFDPFVDSSGTSSLQVVPPRGPDRRLKLVTAPSTVTEGDFVARLASHHVVSRLLQFMCGTRIARSIDDAEQEFRARILRGRDRASTRSYVNHVLRNLDRVIFCVPDAPKDYGNHSDTIERLLGALTNLRRIRISYPGKRGLKDHVLEPLTLALWRSGLYLFARYAHPRTGEEGAVYVFALDRIREIDVLTKHFVYPTEKEWSPTSFTEGSFGIFTPASPNGRKLIAVELVFAKTRWLQAHVRERHWAKNQKCTDLPDGRMRMTFQVNSLETLIPWICQWPGQIEVVKPVELAERVSEELGR